MSLRCSFFSLARVLAFVAALVVPFALRAQDSQRAGSHELCSSGRARDLCGRDLRAFPFAGLQVAASQTLGSGPNIGPDPSYKVTAKSSGQSSRQTASPAAASQVSNGAGADFTGVWYPSTGATLGAATPDNPGQQFVWLDGEGKPMKGPLPMTAWGQEQLKSHRPTGPKTSAIDSDDPDFQCFPSGVPRIYLFLYPMEMIHTPGRVLMLFEYGHNIRQIFTDGRGHAQDAEPTWMGDSIGRWEGDTLIVETTGMNDKTWLGYGGQPHSDQLRVIERIRRPDHGSLMIDITLDDPKAYTMPLHTQKKYILKPDWNIAEFVCEDNSINFLEYEKKTRIEK